MTDQTQPETTDQPKLRTVVPGTAVCPYCSTLIEPEAKTCPGCGAKKHVGPTGVQLLTTSVVLSAFCFVIYDDYHLYTYQSLLSINHPTIGAISPFLAGVVIAISASIVCKILFKKQTKWIRNKKTKSS